MSMVKCVGSRVQDLRANTRRPQLVFDPRHLYDAGLTITEEQGKSDLMGCLIILIQTRILMKQGREFGNCTFISKSVPVIDNRFEIVFP